MAKPSWGHQAQIASVSEESVKQAIDILGRTGSQTKQIELPKPKVEVLSNIAVHLPLSRWASLT